MEKKRIALVMGGKTSEREVSLNSGREVLKYADPERFEVRVYDPASDLPRLAAEASALDAAFLALHGPLGEDGAMQGFCELLGLPYTGSGVLASALAIDKAAAKKIYRDAGLPVARDLLFAKSQARAGELPDLAAMAVGELGLPMVVKPVRQGSSVGLSLVKTEEALLSALDLAFRFDGLVLLEEYLHGQEFTCAVLGGRDLTALPPIEIIPAAGHSFFDYEAKYEPGQCEEICPARISRELTAEISRLAIAAHLALGCRGLSRTDFILSGGRFFLLETNTLPGMTSGSLLPKAVRAYGLSFTALISYLIDLALNPEAEGGEVKLENYRNLP